MLTLMLYANFALFTPVSGAMVWEEPPPVQEIPGYHPIIRFNPESTYMFQTTDFIAQGKYRRDGAHYYFHTITAFELENSDIAKLMEDMNPDAGRKFHEAYQRSMLDFEGDYNASTHALSIAYLVKGAMQSFRLYAFTEGDDRLTPTVNEFDRGLPGVWHAPEPFPDKLDSRWRYKIGGLEGLQRFVREASSSDGAQLNVLDLRVDRSFRLGSRVGTWKREGSMVYLRAPKLELNLTIAANGNQLLLGGKPVYARD